MSWTDDDDLPDSLAERALLLQNLMISRATGGASNPITYKQLRREFMENPDTKALLPTVVRTARDLDQFWGVAKQYATYQERREWLRVEFTPLLDQLERGGAAPSDATTAAGLTAFDAAGVHSIWEKALSRREQDPEGAITAARTLLEAVCKHILDDAAVPYDDGADLPKLYREVAKVLSLAPSEHTEEAFKQILSGCISVVGGLATVRNKISDAHGRGARGAKPSSRHAQLAVNLAGTMATFLVETWAARSEKGSSA